MKKQESNEAHRIAFNSLAETTKLRIDFANLKLPDPVATDEYRDRLSIIQRNADSLNAPKFPKRVAALPGYNLAIRLSVNGVTILFANWPAAGQPTIELISRLADAAAYFFQGSRSRLPKASGGYNFSEAQAQLDSEHLPVNAVLNRFKMAFEIVGIIGEAGRPVKPAEVRKMSVLESCVNAHDSALLTLKHQVEDLQKKVAVLEESLCKPQQGSVPFDSKVAEVVSSIHLNPIPDWTKGEPKF